MKSFDRNQIRLPSAVLIAALLAACASNGDSAQDQRLASASTRQLSAQQQRILNRLTWGSSVATSQRAASIGFDSYLQQQLHPKQATLPPAISAEIGALTISQQALPQLVQNLEASRKAADVIADDMQKKAAQQAYQQELNRIAREAATRSLLRDLYSPNQLQEQMTWFWMNHFNVHQGKHNLRAMVGDYEERAIRPHALGSFRELLRATVHHKLADFYIGG